MILPTTLLLAWIHHVCAVLTEGLPVYLICWSMLYQVLGNKARSETYAVLIAQSGAAQLPRRLELSRSRRLRAIRPASNLRYLNSRYWGIFRVRVSQFKGFLYKTYKYFRVFLAENERFQGSHRAPGSSRAPHASPSSRASPKRRKPRARSGCPARH